MNVGKKNKDHNQQCLTTTFRAEDTLRGIYNIHSTLESCLGTIKWTK